MGSDPPDYRPQVLALVAVPNVTKATWVNTLRTLPEGRSVSVLSDKDNSLFNTVHEVWPLDREIGEASPQIHFHFWHLMKRFRKLTSSWGPRRHPQSPLWQKAYRPRQTGSSSSPWSANSRTSASRSGHGGSTAS